MKKDLQQFKEASSKLINIIDSQRDYPNKKSLIKEQFNSDINKLSYSGNRLQLNGLYRFLFQTVLDCHIDLEKKAPIQKIRTFRNGDYMKLLREHPNDTDILWMIDENPLYIFYRLEYLFKTRWAEFYPVHKKIVLERKNLEEHPFTDSDRDYAANWSRKYREIETITLLYDIFIRHQLDYISEKLDEFKYDSDSIVNAFTSATEAHDHSPNTHDTLIHGIYDYATKYLEENGEFQKIEKILSILPTLAFNCCGLFLLMVQLETEVTDTWLSSSVNYGMEESSSIIPHPFFHIFNTKKNRDRHTVADDFQARSPKSKQELELICESITEHCSNCKQISCIDCPYRFDTTCNTQNTVPGFLS